MVVVVNGLTHNKAALGPVTAATKTQTMEAARELIGHKSRPPTSQWG